MIKRKCVTCLKEFGTFMEYDEHINLEHKALEQHEPFARAYRGGLVLAMPGAWRPMDPELKRQAVAAGERRLGRHHFFGWQCEEVIA